MKFTGDIVVHAPRDAVFAKLRDAQLFVSEAKEMERQFAQQIGAAAAETAA
jgi:hypothetical protein